MNGKILIVDDEPDVLNLAKMILERAGFQILTASNGLEGERTAITEQPDLIILDVVMPGKNGHEVCRSLKGKSATRPIPIIIFSASPSISSKEAAYAAGADSFLTKPFTIEELTGQVMKFFGGEDQTSGPDPEGA